MVLVSYMHNPTQHRHLLMSMSEEGRTEAMSADPKYVVRASFLKTRHGTREQPGSPIRSFHFNTHHTTTTSCRWSCSTSTRRSTTST